jgi:uncharacterized Zn-binding protein involved in type VI secretion
MPLPPPPRPRPPARPGNALRTVAQGIGAVLAVPSAPVQLLNEGFANLTAGISAALPCFPAATLGSLVMGIPHAHVLHPPSGPPPIPPTPLPPIGTILFGTSVQVLINGMPAARCGDLGLNPTCCGLPPIFEVFTGSSKVFIGGARAARVLDVTYHCKPVPPAGAAARGAAAALKAAGQAAMIAGMAAQVATIAADAMDAEATAAEDPAMSAALGMAAGMGAAQMANDILAMAMGAAMGKDPCVPPGTLGAITMGSPNVLIGGFPMPSWMNIARGLLKLVKGLRCRSRGTSGRRGCGCR